MSEKAVDKTGGGKSHKQSGIDDFNDNLQNLVVNQAKRMIDLSLYTKALLSTVPVALIGADKNGLIRSINRAAEEILELAEDKIKGTELSGIFESNSTVSKKVRRALDDGRPFHMRSKNLRLASGKEIIGNLYIQPLLDDEQEICGLLLTVEDQTYINFLQDAFKRYVPPSVSEIIANDPKSLELGGEEKILSVLFSDLEGFTRLSERLPPREMVMILGDYFTEMTGCIFEYQGTLKEYVGDELMAIFGAPVKEKNHAFHACAAALSMKERLSSLRKEWARVGRPVLRARTGINTGPMLVGNLGSRYRFSYGVIGDHVNLASRLEGLCKIYGTDILISQTTAEAVKASFTVRELDLVKVKGRKQPVRIFELISKKDTCLSGKFEMTLKFYAKGLEKYRSCRWKEATGFFEEALKNHPGDNPSKTMFDRCKIYMENPPEKNWHGVFQHTGK
jgi:PAS domain S-box-containing protein